MKFNRTIIEFLNAKESTRHEQLPSHCVRALSVAILGSTIDHQPLLEQA